MDLHNSIMEIHNSIIHNSIMEIHNSIMDLHNYGLFMDLYNWIMDIRSWIMDLHNSGIMDLQVGNFWLTHSRYQWIGCVWVKIYPPEIMQPSSSTRATIVSAENQNGTTIVKATFFFCHYYIVWGSNNAGEARGQSWNESLKSRWIPGGSCGNTSGTKRKHFAALSSPRPCWRWLQLQPSCGSP